MVNPRRLWALAGGSWALLGPNLDSPWSSWRGGLCERTGPSLYGAAGLSRRIFSKRKRHSGGSLGNSPAAAAPVSSLPGCPALLQGCGGAQSPNHWGECTPWGGLRLHPRHWGVCAPWRDLRPQELGRVGTMEVHTRAHP